MSLKTYPDLAQGSDEWLELRRGMVTASTVGQMLAVESADPLSVICAQCLADVGDPCVSVSRKTPTPIKTVHSPRSSDASTMPPVIRPADSDMSRRLTLALVAERITGESESTYMNDDMLRGHLEEPIARDVYREHFSNGEIVTEIAFMVRDDHGFEIGFSPDGLVGDTGCIEIKAPRAKAHLATILAGEVPERHMAQIQCGLYVSGREWCDFISYYGGMPPFVKRVLPDPKWAEAIVNAVAAFEQVAVEMTDKYQTTTRGMPATERRIPLATDLGLVF